MPSNIEEPLLHQICLTIKYFRLKQKLSQEKLASLANLDRTYISGIERKTRNLTINSLENIICALNISSEEFFIQLLKKEKQDELY